MKYYKSSDGFYYAYDKASSTIFMCINTPDCFIAEVCKNNQYLVKLLFKGSGLMHSTESEFTQQFSNVVGRFNSNTPFV